MKLSRSALATVAGLLAMIGSAVGVDPASSDADSAAATAAEPVTTIEHLPANIISSMAIADPVFGGRLATAMKGFDEILREQNGAHAARLLAVAKTQEYPYLTGIQRGLPQGYLRFLHAHGISAKDSEIIRAIELLEEPRRTEVVMLLCDAGAVLNVYALQPEHLDATHTIIAALERHPERTLVSGMALHDAVIYDKRALFDALLARPDLDADLHDALVGAGQAASEYYALQLLRFPNIEMHFCKNRLHLLHRLAGRSSPERTFAAIVGHPKMKRWINARDKYLLKRTPLHSTVYWNNDETAEMHARHLLANGADANAVDADGRMAAFLAVQYGKLSTLHTLLPHMNEQQLNRVLNYAGEFGNAEASVMIRKELEHREIARRRAAMTANGITTYHGEIAEPVTASYPDRE